MEGVNSGTSATAVVVPSKKAEKRMKRIEKTKSKKEAEALDGQKRSGALAPFDETKYIAKFEQHKKHILANLGGTSSCDNSPKGSVDLKCHALMDILNTSPDYITTSSCSGRIALFHSLPPSGTKTKRGGEAALGWLFAKHGVLRAAELQLLVDFLCGVAPCDDDTAMDAENRRQWEEREKEAGDYDAMFAGETSGVLLAAGLGAAVPDTGVVALKMEPFVMHVECRTWSSAKALYTAAATDSGYRNSGVVPPGNKIICAVRTTVGCGMDVPVVVEGLSGVRGNRAYMWSLLHMANAKMVENERKVKLLERSIEARIAASNGEGC